MVIFSNQRAHYRLSSSFNNFRKFLTLKRGRHSEKNTKMLKIYRNLDSILDDLNNYKDDHNGAVANLLAVYKTAHDKFKADPNKNANKYPLIILEGLDGSGKSSIGKRLSRLLQATLCCTPPQSIKHMRQLFDDHPSLRPAYYGLGNYIAALEVSLLLKTRPVVMDRYWHSTCIYAMAQAVHDYPDKFSMPVRDDDFYSWPKDLFKPNKVMFLNVDEYNRLQRLSRRTSWTNQEVLLRDSQSFRDNIITGYSNMRDPVVEFVDCNGWPNKVCADIRSRLTNLFSS